jgi:hypothetical protein
LYSRTQSSSLRCLIFSHCAAIAFDYKHVSILWYQRFERTDPAFDTSFVVGFQQDGSDGNRVVDPFDKAALFAQRHNAISANIYTCMSNRAQEADACGTHEVDDDGGPTWF